MPLSNLVPVLHGQPVDYLMSALKAYAEGKRRSGIMQPLAADLRDEDMRQLATYYAGLRPPWDEPSAVDAALIERGRKLALEGAPEAGVPPCMACHGNSAGGIRVWPVSTPPIWRVSSDFGRQAAAATAGAALMAPIAQQLNDEQIEALSAYFASITLYAYQLP